MAKVLIIDDSRALILTVTMVLQKAGHEVTVCKDATKAAEVSLTDKFDAILCDISMPSHSGLRWFVNYENSMATVTLQY
jgi:CheY-like chemotaxis protein